MNDLDALRKEFAEKVQSKEDLDTFLAEKIPDEKTFDTIVTDGQFRNLQIVISEKFDIEGLGTLQLHIEKLK